MTFWLDAQLPPSLATWFRATFGRECHPLRDLSLRDAEDPAIFEAARDAGAVVITKDSDFVELVERMGPPPQVLWLTCGDTTKLRLRTILVATMPMALTLPARGERIVEIRGLPIDGGGESRPDDDP